MIFGVRMFWIPLLLASLLLLISSAAQALEVSELMGLMAQHPSAEARFVEQRFVQGLAKPLRAAGTLSFKAPDQFSRQTLEPRPESISVQGNTVTLTRNGRSRQMNLDGVPEMAVLVEAIRGTLSGNAASLQKYFRLNLSDQRAQWSLQLDPLDVRLASQVSWITLGGRLGEVRSVEVQLADGDRSLMQIEPVARGASAP